ncbi:hypothetical protein OKW24_001007 [Peribacillus simplex]|nr:hypothetical protein [Peribacillus simplex]
MAQKKLGILVNKEIANFSVLFIRKFIITTGS